MQAPAYSKRIEERPAKRPFTVWGESANQELGGDHGAQDEARDLRAMKVLEFATERRVDEGLDVDV